MTTRDLYRSFSTPTLVLLQQAFLLDKDDARRLSTVAFCDRRIRWIEEELRARGHAPSPPEIPADG